MKKTILSVALLAVMLTACADKQSREPQLDAAAIGFTTQVTRSATGPVYDFSAGDAFDVWARRTLSNGTGNPVEVFSKVPVSTADGLSWAYENPRYWELADYDFAAVFPSGLAGSSVDFSGGGPVFRIDNYNVKDNHDLMTATRTVTYASGEPSPVAFTFGHLLCRVSIAGRAENGDVTINSVTLRGVGETGDYDSSAGWSNVAVGSGFSASNVKLNGTNTDVISSRLMIPQPVTGMEFVVSYRPDGASTDLSAAYELPATGSVSRWEPGRSYRYTFVIYGNQIIFDKPAVTAWDDATGGIIVVE